jgi:beta-glucosidase
LALLMGCSALGLPAAHGAETHPETWPALKPGLLIKPPVEDLVGDLLRHMTLEEKIGQMIQADIASITPEEQRRYKLGAILAGGYAAPGNDVHAPAKAWLALADAFWQASTADGGAHRPIPPFFGIDAVHGDAKIPGATIFPHNVALGAAHDPALLEEIGKATAEEVSATGLDWAFAPTLAVVRDPRWGRSYESYSEDPALVALYAGAMVSGLQGKFGTADFMAPGHVLASAKHFLGDGGTVDGRDQGDNLASEAELRRVHAAGYPPAIEAGVLSVMASYNSWHGVKMHDNAGLLTDVLKGRFGFDGFVVGDWNAQEEIPGCTKYSCAAAINAGLDMLMAPDSWQKLYDNTLAQARSGAIPASRIDDAVRRILRVKALAGLLDAPAPAARPLAGHFELIGSAEHRALARRAVRESLVLLKNENNTLPLKPQGRILVAGAAADDIGRQSGGWTVDWQGDHNSNADFPGATSIFAGLKSAIDAAGGQAVLSADGSFADRPDAAIIVFGETPYAEFEGDRETLAFSDDKALALLKRLKAQNIPVVALLLSGRPLWVDPEINAADAFVAAWLPGSEGGGIADLLLRTADGKIAHDFTGKLGFSWPRSALPVAFDAQDRPRGALFPRGYGLSYAAPGHVGPLPEDPQIPAERRVADTLFHAGHVTAPWSIYLSDAVADVRLTTKRQVSPDNAVTAELDKDLLRLRWAGSKEGRFKITGRATDLRQPATGAISFRYRIDQATTGPVSVVLGCDKACSGSVDISKRLAAASIGHWQSLDIPLTCFAAEGADLSKIDQPFAIASSGALSLTLSEVKLVPASADTGCGGKQS